MRHYGDITKINGAEIPAVDCITFGSPCQDISVAGKRKGMLHEGNGDEETTRSGLFFEAIRVIKEMREHDRSTGRTDEYIRPRFAVYENVPGAFSSNGGRDFQAVLTEIVRIAKPDAPDVPLPDKGRWDKSGCIMGYGEDGCPFSIAWRVHDAQFWGTTQYVDGRMLFCGTPQRRKRISLVADFGGMCAPEVLLERKGLHGHSFKSGTEKQGTAGDTEDGTGETGWDNE